MKKQKLFKEEWNAIHYNNYLYKHMGEYIDEQLLEEMVESDDFLHISWTKLTECNLLTEKFIRDHLEECECYWPNICTNSNLSEDFLREFADRVAWYALIINEKISEKFMKEMRDYIFLSDEYAEKFFSEKKEYRIIENSIAWCLEKGIRMY